MLMLLLACQTPPAPAEAANEPSFAAIALTYQENFRLAVSAQAPPGVWMLCRLPMVGTDIPFHGSEARLASLPGGPDTTITVYVNDTGWSAMQETGPRTFPEGAVIVKQKADGDLGMMRKRADGWLYAYVPKVGAVEDDQAALTHCSSCHEQGSVPESVKALSGPIYLTDPRDAVFLSVAPSGG